MRFDDVLCTVSGSTGSWILKVNDPMAAHSELQVKNAGTTCQWLVGQGLDRKSNLCPSLVQSLSKVRPKNPHVEGRSGHCPSLVKAMSKLGQVKRHLDTVWTGKSRDCQKSVQTN